MSHTLAVVLRDARRASAKHRKVLCIAGRSRKLVRYAGSRTFKMHLDDFWLG